MSRCYFLLAVQLVGVSLMSSTAMAQQDSQPIPQVVPAPPGADQELPPPTVAIVRRSVSVDLNVDEAVQGKKFRFKKNGQVLADLPQVEKDRLSFEVIITGPQGNVSVFFPVSRQSSVYKAYLEHGQAAPDKVLAQMLGMRPPKVRVVAMTKPIVMEKYHELDLVECRVCDHWRPFYEVCLPDVACEPQFIAVPFADQGLFERMNRVLALEAGPPDFHVVMVLSGDEDHVADARPNHPPLKDGPTPGYGRSGG